MVFLFIFFSEEAVHTARKVVRKSTEEFAIREKMMRWPAVGWSVKAVILPDVTVRVLVVKYVVPAA